MSVQGNVLPIPSNDGNHSMIKKHVLGGLIAGLVGVIVLGGVFAGTVSKASELQRDFFAKIASNEVDALTQSMHPSLASQIDPAVMHELVRAIDQRLGKVESISQTEFRIEKNDAGTRVMSQATVRFEKGTATSKLVTLDGKLIQFDVTSPALANWFVVPTRTEQYEALGKKFLEQWLSGNHDVAWALFHPNLQEAISQERLAAMANVVTEKFGPLKSVTPTGTRIGDNGKAPTLMIDFTVVCEQAELAGEIEIQFGGLKGHLLGFKI